ncbi:hypothetical protein HA402_002337 [Bradysia odoriphaga]|nr:hypothetical protein HA402_002337 [Bradysia odoriphaga]
MGIEATEPEDFADTNDGHSNYMNLLLSAKRSLQKYTPTLLKDARIDDDKLITEVLERNRRGQKKMIQKIVCPFCFTSVAPQNRSGTRRWDITNFNRHLIKIHGQHV